MEKEGGRKRVCGEKEQALRSSAYIKTNKAEDGLADGVSGSGLGSEGGWRGLQASRVPVNSKVGSRGDGKV